MREPNPLFSPYTAIRTAISDALAGDGYRLRYIGNGNDGDAVRGQHFAEARSWMPATVFINERPPTREGKSDCSCMVVRNPSVDMSESLSSLYPKDCGCRLIVDLSAPFWSGYGFDLKWPNGQRPHNAKAVVAAIKSAANVADVVTVPWPEYAKRLREHEGLNALHVPDFDPYDETYAHAIAWCTAIVTARNRVQ